MERGVQHPLKSHIPECLLLSDASIWLNIFIMLYRGAGISKIWDSKKHTERRDRVCLCKYKLFKRNPRPPHYCKPEIIDSSLLSFMAGGSKGCFQCFQGSWEWKIIHFQNCHLGKTTTKKLEPMSIFVTFSYSSESNLQIIFYTKMKKIKPNFKTWTFPLWHYFYVSTFSLKILIIAIQKKVLSWQ